MRPRLPIARVRNNKRLSRASKSTRASRKIPGTDEYFLRSWVLDELNKALKPISKDIYSLRKTLYEEKRDILNRVSLLEDDVRNIMAIVTSDRSGRYPKRWMSHSSIDPSNTSSVDNIAEISESHSPVMIDVQRLELHLQQKSLEDLTLQGDKIRTTFTRTSQSFLNGATTHHNLQESMSRANKRSWQCSQSMDTGLDLIPSEHTDSPMTYIRKRRGNDNVSVATSYSENRHVMGGVSCRRTIGSSQSIIDEDLKENEDPTKKPTKRRIEAKVHDVSFTTKCAKRSGWAGTQDTLATKPLNNNSIDGVESIFKEPKAKVEATRGKEVERKMLEAVKEGRADVNKFVQLIEGRHRKYSDAYAELCKFIQERNGMVKLSMEDLKKIDSSQEKFLGLLEKSKSGLLIEADAKLAQDLVDDMEATYAKLQAIGILDTMKMKKNPEGEHFKNPPQNEIQKDIEQGGTLFCDEMKSAVPVKRPMYELDKENQALIERKKIKILDEELDKISANVAKNNPEYVENHENNGGLINNTRKLQDRKKAKDKPQVKQNEPLHKKDNSNSCVSVQSKEKALQCKQDGALPQKTAPIERFEDYLNLLENFKKVEEGLAEFSKDKSLKKLRTDCQKTINLTLNTISAQCPSHLLDKYEKLSKFLNNGNVTILERSVTASLHPLGALFSVNYLAMKTVKQGELCVSHNPEHAYAIASVVVALWTDMPLYGKLLLSNFYQASPYLIPAYWEKGQDESEEEYKRLGFLYPKNEKENLDRFLKRQSGIMRLYSAIMVTPHKASNTTKQHPLPISEAWKWLTTFITLPPKPDISATVLLDLLEVTGHMLASTYKAQFWKIVNTINISFLPSIEQVTPAERRGPFCRLQLFLERALARKTVPPPKGLLPPDFW